MVKKKKNNNNNAKVLIKMKPTRPISLTSTTVNITEVHVNYNPVVLVDRCPEADLEALFYWALKPDSKKRAHLPMRMRQLPESFFIPPPKGSKTPSMGSKTLSNTPFIGSKSPCAESKSPSTGSKTPPMGSNSPCTGSMLPSPGSKSLSTGLKTPSMGSNTPAIESKSPSAGSKSPSTGSKTPSVSHSYENSIDSAFSVIDKLLGPLPLGWELAQTPEGQIYFLNHLNKTSQWEDPRWSLVVGETFPFSDGCEQAYTADGDIYFINHLTKTTSWFDPSLTDNLQSAPTSVTAEHPSSSESWLENDASDVMWSTQVPQQELNIHSLQRQMQRQEFLHQQELMLCSNQPTDQWCNTSNEDHDLHNRQESADSGLGNHSLPHIPGDFLSSNTDNTMDKNTNDHVDGTSDTDNGFAGNGHVGRQKPFSPFASTMKSLRRSEQSITVVEQCCCCD